MSIEAGGVNSYHTEYILFAATTPRTIPRWAISHLVPARICRPLQLKENISYVTTYTRRGPFDIIQLVSSSRCLFMPAPPASRLRIRYRDIFPLCFCKPGSWPNRASSFMPLHAKSTFKFLTVYISSCLHWGPKLRLIASTGRPWSVHIDPWIEVTVSHMATVTFEISSPTLSGPFLSEARMLHFANTGYIGQDN